MLARRFGLYSDGKTEAAQTACSKEMSHNFEVQMLVTGPQYGTPIVLLKLKKAMGSMGSFQTTATATVAGGRSPNPCGMAGGGLGPDAPAKPELKSGDPMCYHSWVLLPLLELFLLLVSNK